MYINFCVYIYVFLHVYVCNLSVSIKLRVNASFQVFEPDSQNVLKNKGPN